METKEIIIEGKFTIKGDLPSLNKFAQPMKVCKIKIPIPVWAFIDTFSAWEDTPRPSQKTGGKG